MLLLTLFVPEMVLPRPAEKKGCPLSTLPLPWENAWFCLFGVEDWWCAISPLPRVCKKFGLQGREGWSPFSASFTWLFAWVDPFSRNPSPSLLESNLFSRHSSVSLSSGPQRVLHFPSRRWSLFFSRLLISLHRSDGTRRPSPVCLDELSIQPSFLWESTNSFSPSLRRSFLAVEFVSLSSSRQWSRLPLSMSRADGLKTSFFFSASGNSLSEGLLAFGRFPWWGLIWRSYNKKNQNQMNQWVTL